MKLLNKKVSYAIAGVAIITLAGLGGTLSKYTTAGTGNDSARVAKWAANSTMTVNLFSSSYTGTGGGNTVFNNEGTEKLVAPGTTQTATLNFAGAKDATAEVTQAVKINSLVLTNASEIPLTWAYSTNGGGSFTEASFTDMNTVLTALPDAGQTANAIQIKWTWAFSTSDPQDIADTTLGTTTTPAVPTVSLAVNYNVNQVD